jgi:hypothetical protein
MTGNIIGAHLGKAAVPKKLIALLPEAVLNEKFITTEEVD